MKICFLSILLISCAFAGHAFAQNADVLKRKNIEAQMLAVARWQLLHPNHNLHDWTNGAFYAGIFAAYETTKSPDLMAALLDMGEKNKWLPGPRFDHADDPCHQPRFLQQCASIQLIFFRIHP